MSKHFSDESRKEIIQRVLQGEKLSVVARDTGVSRTILYKWLQKNEPIEPRKITSQPPVLPSRHPKAFDRKTERKIIQYALKNPEYSPHKIAEALGVGHNGVWRVLKRNNLNTEEKRSEYIEKLPKPHKQVMGPPDKLALIARFEKGERVASLCREYGISRTAFYNWLEEYKQEKAVISLEDKRPKGENHWKHVPNIKELVLKIIQDNPEYSPQIISRKLTEMTGVNVLGHHGVHNILKTLNLNTYEKRLAYVQATAIPDSIASLGSHNEYPGQSIMAQSIPLPTIPASFWIGFFKASTLVLAFIAVFSLSFFTARVVAGPLSTVSKGTMKMLAFSDNKTDRTDKQNYVVAQETAQKEKTPETAPLPQKAVLGAQDFSWGVLAMNFEKSEYQKGEAVVLHIAVLNHQGTTICNASLHAIITTPSEEVIHLSTDNGKIALERSCHPGRYKNNPDYTAQVRADQIGTYHVALTAETPNGHKEVEDFFEVVSAEEYNARILTVERINFPTRIYPAISYTVSLAVNSKKRYLGEIVEKVPSGVTVTDISNGGILSQVADYQIIRWNIHTTANSRQNLSYRVVFPEKSPEFYAFGPLQAFRREYFTTENSQVLGETSEGTSLENRAWQIAGDGLVE